MSLEKVRVLGTVAEIDEMESQFIIRKAASMVARELGCSPADAIAAICKDWMHLRQVEIISPNQLEHSTPADYKPSWFDHLKRFF